jgi:hypothetical protein
VGCSLTAAAGAAEAAASPAASCPFPTNGGGAAMSRGGAPTGPSAVAAGNGRRGAAGGASHTKNTKPARAPQHARAAVGPQRLESTPLSDAPAPRASHIPPMFFLDAGLGSGGPARFCTTAAWSSTSVMCSRVGQGRRVLRPDHHAGRRMMVPGAPVPRRRLRASLLVVAPTRTRTAVRGRRERGGMKGRRFGPPPPAVRRR